MTRGLAPLAMLAVVAGASELHAAAPPSPSTDLRATMADWDHAWTELDARLESLAPCVDDTTVVLVSLDAEGFAVEAVDRRGAPREPVEACLVSRGLRVPRPRPSAETARFGFAFRFDESGLRTEPSDEIDPTVRPGRPGAATRPGRAEVVNGAPYSRTGRLLEASLATVVRRRLELDGCELGPQWQSATIRFAEGEATTLTEPSKNPCLDTILTTVRGPFVAGWTVDLLLVGGRLQAPDDDPLEGESTMEQAAYGTADWRRVRRVVELSFPFVRSCLDADPDAVRDVERIEALITVHVTGLIQGLRFSPPELQDGSPAICLATVLGAGFLPRPGNGLPFTFRIPLAVRHEGAWEVP